MGTDEDVNQYLRAISETDPVEQAEALRTFAQDEVEQRAKHLESLDVKDDAAEWNYTRGRLDAMRLVHGMAFQMEQMALAQQEQEGE